MPEPGWGKSGPHRQLTDGSGGQLPLQVMYPRNRRPSARVRGFVDWVIELHAGKFAQPSSRDGS
jgi:hypothetical protein